MKTKQQAILLMIASAFCFALMNACVRLAGDLPSVEKSFFRNLVAFFFALILMVKHHTPFRVEKGNWGWMLLRAGFGTLGILCNFYAVDHLLLADASMLNKMSPFFAVVCSVFLLKEKLRLWQGILVGAAFAGSLLVIKPDFTSLGSFPALVGLLGGLSAGIAYTMVRKLGQRGQNGASIVLFFSGFSCLVTLPWLIFDFVPMSWTQLLWLLGAGLAAAGGQFAITAAYLRAPAREISVYDYSQILFASGLGFLLFGQVPDLWSGAGYAVIVGAAVALFWYNNYYLPQKPLPRGQKQQK